MTIRAAMLGDISKVVDLGEIMHGESVFSKYDFDKYYLHHYTKNAIENPDRFGVFVNDVDDEIIGMICGFITPHYFSPEVKVAHDFLTYVHPSKRGGTAAVRLVKRYEDWAKAVGAKEVKFGISAGIDNERAEKFYSGLGYVRSATIFMKEF